MATFTINGHTYGTSAADVGVSDGYKLYEYGWIAALPNLVNDIVAVAASVVASAASAISAPGTSATSTTSITIGTGSKTLTIQTGKSLVVGASVKVASTASATNWMHGDITAYNSGSGSFTVNVTTVNGSGTFSDWTISLSAPIPGVGKQTSWMPASAMNQNVTNGATFNTSEIGTNKLMLSAMVFDPAVNKLTQFAIEMPKSWDRGQLTAQFVFRQVSAGSGAVVWAIQAVATSDGDPIDAAWGTAITVTKTAGTVATQYTTAETSGFTVAGSPAAQDVVRFQVYRDAVNVSDTLAVDAYLEGVTVYYNTVSGNDA